MVTSQETLWLPFASYLRHRRLLEESTVTAYRTALNRLLRFVGVHELRLLRVSDLENYLGTDASWPAKQQTLVAYRMFHKWGARHGHWILDQAIDEIRLRRRPRPRSKALQYEQVSSLLHAPLNAVLTRVVYLGLYAGLRISGMASVTADSWFVDASGGSVLKVFEKGKGREVPVHRELQKKRDVILGHEATYRQLKRAIPKLRIYVEDEAFTSHWLRHTFGVTLSKQGVERTVIRELFGHAPEGVTSETYVPARWDEMVHAVRVLRYGSGQMRLFN